MKVLDANEFNREKLISFLNEHKSKKFVVTPIKILKKLGFPVSEHRFILDNKSTISQIQKILKELEKEGVLLKRESTKDFKGIKEVGYDLFEKY